MVISIVEPETFVEVWPGEGPPEISILMPIFQQEHYVREAVESILAQRNVIAEIIISDDASTDLTFEAASHATRVWLAERGSNHRIVMRRGTRRLRRDHLALLVESAFCNIVCQAHGDDVSHPDRARILVAFFRAFPKATMLVSEASDINEAGEVTGKQKPVSAEISAYRFSFEEIVGGHDLLVGFSQAWRRNAISQFKRLDHSLAAVGHDRILAFRAGLTGEVHLIKEQLLKGRMHAANWTKRMFHEPDTEGLFGWNLAHISELAVMKQDLLHAKEMGLIADDLHSELVFLIEKRNAYFKNKLLEGYRIQTSLGRQIAWVDEMTLVSLQQEKRK